MGYIPQRALANLKKYQYKGVCKSFLIRHILGPFWTWFVTLWPPFVAPNTITLIGLAIIFFNFFTLLYYDPLYLTEKEGNCDPPQWVYFTWAIGLFMYQSLDAIDGKQARRTGMSGPLGELFDHGCDALNTTLECILASRALGLGRSWWTVSSQIATLANFYLTTWEEYHTGQLYLSYVSGPVEGILIIVTIYIITGICGPTVWDNRIWTITKLENFPLISSLPNLRLNEAFMVFGGFGLAFNILESYNNVRTARRSARLLTSRINPNNARFTTYPLLLLLPFLFTVLLQVAWLSHPEYNNSYIIHSAAFVPFLCGWGLQFAHQVGRMILAHLTSTPFPVWNWIWVWSALGAFDANMPRMFGRAPFVQTSLRNTTIVVWVTLLISLFTYARFCTLVIKDITEYLGVACFTVRKRDETGVWRDVSGDVKRV